MHQQVDVKEEMRFQAKEMPDAKFVSSILSTFSEEANMAARGMGGG